MSAASEPAMSSQERAHQATGQGGRKRAEVRKWRSTRLRGMALVAALLTLAAIATLVLGSTVLWQLDIRLAANRQALALARAESRSRLTLNLLELEALSSSGQLPDEAPVMPGLVAYSRSAATVATLSVVGEAAGGRYRSDAWVELLQVDGYWRLHVVEMR
jgi:hypothetical protein